MNFVNWIDFCEIWNVKWKMKFQFQTTDNVNVYVMVISCELRVNLSRCRRGWKTMVFFSHRLSHFRFSFPSARLFARLPGELIQRFITSLTTSCNRYSNSWESHCVFVGKVLLLFLWHSMRLDVSSIRIVSWRSTARRRRLNLFEFSIAKVGALMIREWDWLLFMGLTGNVHTHFHIWIMKIFFFVL